MTYVLILVFHSYGLNIGFSASEFSTKKACEAALKAAYEVNDSFSLRKALYPSSKCVEVPK